MAGEALGAAGHREVGAELQGALPERGREGVVDGDEGPAGVCGLHEAAYVADVEPGVGRGFQPQQPRPVEDRELTVVAGGGGAHVDPVRLQLFPYERQGLVAVVGQDDGVAGARLGEQDGGDRGHAGGEDDGVHSVLAWGFQFPDGPLQQGPGGVGVAGVGVRALDVAGEVEVGREDRAGQGRLVLDGLGQAGADGDRAVAEPGRAAGTAVG